MARVRVAEAMERGRACAAMIYDEGRPEVADWQLAWVWCLAQVAPNGPAVECGVAHGGSVATWAAARQGRGRVIAVDTKFRAGCRERWATYGYSVEALTMPSWEAPAVIGEPVAFAFIDADHSEAGVPRDVAAWPAAIMPGGILAFHDYDVWKPGVVVKRYVDEWQARARWQYLGCVGALIAFRRPGGAHG